MRSADPALPPARERDRRRGRLHPRPGRRVPRRPAHRLDEGAAGRGLGRRLRRLRRAARARPGHARAARRRPTHIHIGIDWLASVSFGHVTSGQASASSCSAAATPRWTAAARRAAWAPSDVKVIVRSRLRGDEGLAVGEGGRHARGHPDHQLPRAQGLRARGRPAGRHALRDRRSRCTTTRAGAAWCPPASPTSVFDCDEVLVAVGQENAFPWIERDCGIEFDDWGLPVLDAGDASVDACRTCSSAATPPSARRTSSPRWRTATRRRCRSTASCTARTCAQRPPPHVNLMSQKMGIHEWSYDNALSDDTRFKVPWAAAEKALASIQRRGRTGLRRRHRLQGSRSAA